MVANQRLMRPVVGVGDVQIRAVGGCCPGRPEEEGIELGAFVGVRQGVFFHRIGFAQFVQLRGAAEQFVVIGGNTFDRADAVGRKGDLAGCLVVSILAERLLRVVMQRGLIALRKLVVGLAVFALCLLVEPAENLAVNPVSGPVRRLIRAVSPDRTDRHAANGLPGGLAGENIGLGVKRFPVFIDEFSGNRWAFVINFLAEIAKDDERTNHN